MEKSKQFQFDGGAGSYILTAVIGWSITIFTFGLGYPWALCMYHKWRTEHTIINGKRLKFIGGGNKVKVSMRFRGREMEHKNLGFDLLKKLTEQVVEHAKVEVHPKSEGRQIMMILVPQVAK